MTHDLRRVIGFSSGTALIVGITIGSGIFRTPPTVAGLVPSPLVIMALWVAFGLISICGALTVAELSSMLPRTGGVYVFLREAYGDAAAFVFGWIYVLVTTPATMAALATVFAEFLLNLLRMPSNVFTVQAIGIAAIVTLTFANVLGARVGAAVSEATTVVKVAALAAIILGAFLLGHGSASNLLDGGPVKGDGLARAMASVIWTYDGWIAVSMIAGEVVAPERLMKRIIIAGMLTIVILYVGANLAYLYMMPIERLVAAERSHRANGDGVDRRSRRRHGDHAGGDGERIRRAQRQLPRQAARGVCDGARRSHVLVSRESAPALCHAVARDADTERRRNRYGARAERLRQAHHLLRRRRVGRAHFRRRGGVRAAPQDGRRATAVSHAGISMGAALSSCSGR